VLLREVSETLQAAGFLDGDEEAAALVAAADGVDGVLRDLLARRVDGEPLEWLTGFITFLGHNMRIDPGVYVPRRQSEIVARRAIERLPHDGMAVDMATGSGAIAVALSNARPRATVMATEIDPLAAKCAVANGVDVLVGDLGGPLPIAAHGRVDVVVAVVPYVPSEEMVFLPRDVRRHEPSRALDGGPRGLVLLSEAVRWAGLLLRAGGSLVLELGGSQDTGLQPSLTAAGFELVDRLRDDEGDLRGVEAIRSDHPPEGR
jgi:release factor glutamine methyltransferase